uniref:hypothetical protein n=1 Tax=Salmonella sp. TaxID=599 RepID=UPI001CD930D3|nr:hypothetical protein [Salmonella sp.]
MPEFQISVQLIEAACSARINPVSVAADGSVYIDDSLTTYKTTICDSSMCLPLMNAIARDFYGVFRRLSTNRDGITKETPRKQ